VGIGIEHFRTNMLCQLCRNRIEPFAPGGFELAADAGVARRTPHRR
jgi:hypothetical protein